MPVSNGPTTRDGGVFQSLPQEHHRANFVIHEASLVHGMPLDQFSGMIFCISILGKDAEVLAGYCRVWISGSVMNRLITVNNKKKIKFVYVETIFNKPGWVPLQKGDCCAVGVSNDGAVGFCNDGNNGSSDSDDGSDDEKVDHATVADNSKSAASKRKSRVSSIDFADEVHGEERMPKRATAIEGQSYANAAIESRGMMDVQKESV